MTDIKENYQYDLGVKGLKRCNLQNSREYLVMSFIIFSCS